MIATIAFAFVIWIAAASLIAWGVGKFIWIGDE